MGPAHKHFSQKKIFSAVDKCPRISYIKLMKDKNLNTDQAWQLVGGLSKPGKMPGWSIGIPAKECKTGSKLRKIKGSVCELCYALKGMYRFSTVQAAQYKRLDAIKNPYWVEAMAAVIKRQKWFRWHDAGDVQSHQHMAKIIEVCKLTPDTKHWLPTQERQYLPAPEDVPENLIIRLSRSKIDGPSSSAWSHESGVTTSENRTCPVPDQGGKCLSCRKC